MGLKIKEIHDYLVFAKKLVNHAEQIIKKNPINNLKVDFKFDKSPVTKIDKTIERNLRSLIKKKYPNHGIYGEEYTNKKINSSYVWVIDPIDGTKNFINGNGSYGTLIALCIDGFPVFGIINSPQLKKKWKYPKLLNKWELIKAMKLNWRHWLKKIPAQGEIL